MLFDLTYKAPKMTPIRYLAALFILTVFLAACLPPAATPQATQAPAQEPAAVPQTAAAPTAGVGQPTAVTAPATTAMIQPQQVSIDTQGLPYGWQANLVPASPYDASQPPGPTGLPEHIVINFGVTNPDDKKPGDPIMYLIPVDAYELMWDEAGDPFVSASVTKIYSWTVALQAPPPTSGLAALPPEEVTGVNDLAVHIDRAKIEAESASKSGYRFVGRWAQDANPVTTESRLMYTYQGFTNDGKYLVSFFYPVTTASLPKQAEMTAADMEKFNSDPQAFIAEQAKMLNELPSSAWQPDLTTLDKLVGSLRITGMPATGLQGTRWEWRSSTYQGQETPVDNPEQYQVVYQANGDLQIKADCNNVTGTYTYDGGMVGGVRTKLGAMTLAECGPESRSEELISSLAAAQDFRVQPGGDELRLNMPAGGPVLIFRNAGF